MKEIRNGAKSIDSQIVENAKMRAKIITSSAREQYKTEVDVLKLFIEKWNIFVNETVKSYPSDKTRKLVAVADMIKEILLSDDVSSLSNKQKIEEIYKLTEGVVAQNRSLYGVSDNGFDMEEVLNPKGNLDLMELCKELGVTE
ncbi:MAG: hypothetical protein J6R29_02490 [Clostridia bacterium]|nr:hypothetical protein [Clostridia bacterium]